MIGSRTEESACQVMLSVRCPHVMVRMRGLAVARRTCAAIMLLVGMTMLVGCAASGTAEASGSNKSSANGLSVTLPLRSMSATKWAPATGSDAQYLGYLPQLFAAQLRGETSECACRYHPDFMGWHRHRTAYERWQYLRQPRHTADRISCRRRVVVPRRRRYCHPSYGAAL